MAQITTSAVSDVLAPPPTAAIARDNSSGYLYALVQTATATLTVYRSTNGGTSWGSWASFSQSNLAEWSSLVIDGYGYGHLAYRISTTGGGGTDTIWYRRFTTSGTSGSFSSGLQASLSDSNGGTAGGTWQGVDLAVVRNPNGTYAIVVAGARTVGTSYYGVQAMAVSINEYGTIYKNNPIIAGTRAWTVTGTAPGRSGVTCEVEHNGNGWSTSTPHVWITWGRQRLEMVKLSWTGSSSGWAGPTKSVVIKSGLSSSTDFAAGRWDGSQWLMAIISPDDTSAIRVYQRDRANTKTTTFDTPTPHPTGVIRWYTLSYDNTTKNIRVYAVGTSTNVLYYVDYVRATSTWTSWASVVGTAILSGTEFSVRKGGSSGNSKHDIAYGVSGAPNTIQHLQQSTSTVPSIPTWDYTGAAYTNGGAAEAAAALVLKWNFIDQDPGDVQSAYALSRQIGSGTIQYWNATTSTWGASEVQNTSATSQVSLASGWGADADLPHTYKVKVWDTAGNPSVGYSTALQVSPSVKVNPTITAPAAAAVLTSDSVTITWTVAEQSAYRVQLVSTTPATGTVYDTGKVMGTDLSYTVPFSMPNGTAYTINLWTYNNEGLASTVQSRNFTVSYAPPPGAVPTLTPVPASGWMAVGVSALSPVGTQPSIATMDLYRRVKLYSVLNPNMDMAGNVTGWTGVGGTLTYSTTQSYSSPGSARLVPSGAAADSLVRLTTPIDVSAIAAAGGSMLVQAWIRPDTANKSIKLNVDFYDSGGSLLGSVGTTFAAVVATAWHSVTTTADFTAFPTATKIGVSVGLTGTPAAGDAFYADDITVRRNNSDTGVAVSKLQGLGVTVNDWQAPGNTDLEYRWVAKGSNGTTLTGPWAG